MDEVETTFRAEGAWPALEVFNAAFAGEEAAEEPGADGPGDSAEADELGPGSMAEPSAEVQARMQQNFGFFIGYEVPSFAKYRVELEALSEANVVIAVGNGSKEEPWARAARVLAERLGHQAVVFPGDHGGFGSEYDAFAVKLEEVLRGGA
jgi:hypothetical protein